MPSAYEVLNVPRGAPEGEIKLAYRRALLANHPDKLAAGAVPVFTIDEINRAYEQITTQEQIESSEGLEDLNINFNDVVDLAEFEEDEMPDGTYQWTRQCRCGGEFLLLQRDLELNGEADEIAVQCMGCSIVILVQYSVQ